MRVSMSVVTYITVDMPDEKDPEEAMHEVMENMDYAFSYNENGIRITDTEVMEASLH